MSHLVSLGDVAQINPPLSAPPDENTLVSFVDMNSVSTDGFIAHSQVVPLSSLGKQYRNFERGDVILAKITPCMENGKAALASDIPTQIAFGSTEFHVLRPSSAIDGRYLFYAIWNGRFRKKAEASMTGSAGQQRVPSTFVREYRIPLPPLAEQRRIAAILDKADALRRKRQEAIALTEQLLRSTFLEMFGDPVTNPKRWPTRPLAAFGEITTGNTPPRQDAKNYGGTIEWIKSDNINTPHHTLTRASEFLTESGASMGRRAPAGAILVTCIAGSLDCIGNAAIANRSVAFNQQINAITPSDREHTAFLYAHTLLAKPTLQERSTGGMKGMLSKSRLAEIPFLNPPHSLVKNFHHFFERFQALCESSVRAAGDAEALFNTLTHRAFAGQL